MEHMKPEIVRTLRDVPKMLHHPVNEWPLVLMAMRWARIGVPGTTERYIVATDGRTRAADEFVHAYRRGRSWMEVVRVECVARAFARYCISVGACVIGASARDPVL